MNIRQTARRVAFAAFAGLAGAYLALPAFAQPFPSKPITLICPWPVGGSSDLVLRAFAEAAGKQLGLKANN